MEAIPSTYIRLKNPKFNHLEGGNRENFKYFWGRREDLLGLVGLSQSSSHDIQYVDNTPANIKMLEKKSGYIKNMEIAGENFKVRGFFSDEEILPVNKLLDWEGNEFKSDIYTWIAGEPGSKNFNKLFMEWGREVYGEKQYNNFVKANNGLWIMDSPKMITLPPSDNKAIIDEGYIVKNTDRRLGAELAYTAKIHKNLRVVNYEERKATYKSPDPNRPISKVRAWHVEDAEVGIRYEVNGHKFNIPYDVNRTSFVRYDKRLEGSAWKQISYGLIKNDSNGKPYIEVYSEDGERLGIIVEHFYPVHMHPADQLTKDEKTGLPRIEFDVFPKRVGRSTWLVADYGDNYGNELYDRYRTVHLDFDKEAKQEFWPNFIVSARASSDGEYICFTTIAPNCETVPFDKKWAGIAWAKDARVLEVDMDLTGSGYIDPINHTWSPKADKNHTEKVDGGIMLVRDADGTEKVVQISSLPQGLQNPKNARRVISVENEGDHLTFNKLRLGSRLKDDPGFVYTLPQHLFDSMDDAVVKPGYRQLRHLLERQDITVKIEMTDGRYSAKLYDENGRSIDIHLDLTGLVDNEGKHFLQNSKHDMKDLDSFYQRNDGNYSGTEEYRPRLIMTGGVTDPQIKLIFTRVEKIRVRRTSGNENIFNLISETKNPLMFFANPSAAAKVKIGDNEKWVPMSLTKKIDYKGTPNMARVEVKVREGEGSAHKYLNISISKDLPERTLYIKYDKEKGEFCAFTLKPKRNEDNYIVFSEVNLGVVSPEVGAKILESIKENNIQDPEEIRVEIFHTRNPEIIDGEYQSVIHGQRQHGGYYRDELFPATDAAQLRDELFYGVAAELFAEVFPPNGDPFSHGIQRGKTYDFDGNDNYTGKPIENGVPFMNKHRHLIELVEVALGFPKGTMIALAPVIDRCGGYEKMMGKHGSKLMLYCREKGWLNGVSEDEQGALALALALGYTMKYFVKVTTFESQPNRWGQLKQQDYARYNTTMALGKDVLIPWEGRQFMRRLAGGHTGGTIKRIFEHLAFRLWYEWPKAKMAREFSPIIYLASGGNIKPYVIDPYFMFSWAFDFGVDIWMNARIRKSLGRTEEATGHGALYWTLIGQPSINQSYLFPALQSGSELFKQGWQYGPFAITALYKASKVPPEYKTFISMLKWMQRLTALYGLFGTVPASALSGIATDLGYYVNEFWAIYSAYINYKGEKFIKESEIGNPSNELKTYKGPDKNIKQIYDVIHQGNFEEAKRQIKKLDSEQRANLNKYLDENKNAIEFMLKRKEASSEIDKTHEEYGYRLKEAYELACTKSPENIQKAKGILNKIISEPNKYKDPDMVILARSFLSSLGG
jgi:hypothetical protein